MTAFKPIRNSKDYESSLDRIDALMDAEWGSPQGIELDTLVDCVEQYESEHEPMMHYPSEEMEVGVTAAELAERYPRLFHMAAPGSWPMIERHGLRSTSALLDLFCVSGAERERIESCHRSDSIPIRRADLGCAVVRDQKPMRPADLTANSKCGTPVLRDGLTPSDWYRILNSKVFFWPARDRLERMLKAYDDMWNTVLIVDTASLLAKHFDRVSLSPINSGNTKPFPQPRGCDTFLSPGKYPFRRWRKKRGSSGDPIAELAVTCSVPDIREHVVLVEERRAGAPPRPIWRPQI